MPGHSLTKIGKAWVYVHDQEFKDVLANLPQLNLRVNERARGKPRPWTNPSSGNDVDLKTIVAYEASILDGLQRWETTPTSSYKPKAKDDHSLILELLQELVKELKKRKNRDGSTTPKNLWRSDANPPGWPPYRAGTQIYRQPAYDNFIEGYVVEFWNELAQKPDINPVMAPAPTNPTQLGRVAKVITIAAQMFP